jgi:hypothetical protein
MQKIIIKEISFKTGTNDKGEWKLTQITGADGAKFASFDHHASELKAGDTIEAEIEIKGKNNNIKSFKVIENTAPIATLKHVEDKMSPSQWAEKDRIERASIEAQTAFKGIIELATYRADLKFNGPDKFSEVLNRALDWAMEKLGGKPVTAPTPQKEAVKQPDTVKTTEDKPARNPDSLKTITDMQKAIHTDFGLQPADILKELNLNNWKDMVITPAEAYKQIASVRK